MIFGSHSKRAIKPFRGLCTIASLLREFEPECAGFRGRHVTIATVAAAPSRGHLLKILGVTFGVAVAIGQIIGSGILRSPSIIASEVPGIALILGLWVLGAIQISLAANL